MNLRNVFQPTDDEDLDTSEDVTTILAHEILSDLMGAYDTNLPTQRQVMGWIEEHGYESVEALTKECVSSGSLGSVGGYMFNKLKEGWEPVKIPKKVKTRERSLWITNLYDHIKEHGVVEVFATPLPGEEKSETPEVVLDEEDIAFFMSNSPESMDDPCTHWTEEIKGKMFWMFCLGTRLTVNRTSIPELIVSRKFKAFETFHNYYLNEYQPDTYDRLIKTRQYMEDQIAQGVPGREAFTARYGALGIKEPNL